MKRLLNDDWIMIAGARELPVPCSTFTPDTSQLPAETDHFLT